MVSAVCFACYALFFKKKKKKKKKMLEVKQDKGYNTASSPMTEIKSPGNHANNSRKNGQKVSSSTINL